MALLMSVKAGIFLKVSNNLNEFALFKFIVAFIADSTVLKWRDLKVKYSVADKSKKHIN
jgi:hypothetical protein